LRELHFIELGFESAALALIDFLEANPDAPGIKIDLSLQDGSEVEITYTRKPVDKQS
jgi:hypothetical protein